MNRSWQEDSCDNVRAYFSIYPVPVAAALWCGIPAGEVDEQLGMATAVYRAVLQHPYIPCLEPRCRAIHDAIDNGILPVSRENGRATDDHVAPERRHVSRKDLKTWIANEFPADKPAFLFDEIERHTHSSITPDAYRALKAAHDAKEQKLLQANERIRETEEAKGKAETERDSLRAMVDSLTNKLSAADVPGARAEKTYLNIIAALLDCINGSLPGIERHPSFASEAKLIEEIDRLFDGYAGLSASNLSRKFPEAKRSIQAG